MSSPSPDPKPQPSPEPEQDPKGKEKEIPVDTEDDPTTSTPSVEATANFSVGAWQAIFSPQHSAYYFHNASTNETTWVNPLQSPPSDPSTSTTTQDTEAAAQEDGLDGAVNPNPYDPNSLEARAIAAGIDPSLAYLDPSLAGPSSIPHSGSFTAKFNARTGAFTAADARAPSHLSEYERMKRMSQFYFDVGTWEKEVEQRDEEEKVTGGKKRKRPTKKDLVSVFGFSVSPLRETRDDEPKTTSKSSTDGRADTSGSFQERFKEQKKLKKIAKTAWLRT
ncbi:hypothetical protein JVU11DRAFT_9700 [Chiua virens]|nr:hypothetical protein JVU11DRAFT_9700 [Chiua virens]